jgi:phosphatidylglycerol:prolipoprotein diacylglycerol transferase
MSELWRDIVGRGQLLGGAVDGPQVAAVLMVLAGALLLLERNAHRRKNEEAHV